MDSRRFDDLTRLLATRPSRRRVLQSLLGVALAGHWSAGERPRVAAQQSPPIAPRGGSNPSATGSPENAGQSALTTTSASSIEIDYIALGDSVASGHGLMDEDGARCEADGVGCCHRSTRAYPYLVADELRERGYTVNFPGGHHLACSGATSSHLSGQVEQAITLLSTRPEGRPAIVSITIGANDFAWTDPLNWVLQVLRVGDPLGGSDKYFEWINETVDGIMENLGVALTKLLRERDVSVVVTEYPNPINRESVYFTAKSHAITASSVFCAAAATFPAAQAVCNALVGSASVLASCVDLMGSLSCYERTDRAVAALNGGIVAAAGRHAGESRVRRALVVDVFVGRESPRPSCGNAEPDATASYIQYIGQPNLNSTVPLDIATKLALGIPLNATGDCFHPNDAGAQVIAASVVDEALAILSNVFPISVTSGPDVVDISESSATIVWTTSVPARGSVEYGRTPNYGRSRPRIPSSEYTTEHRVLLDNLDPGVTYHFITKSVADTGAEAVTPNATFATLQPVPTEPTFIVELQVTGEPPAGAEFALDLISPDAGWPVCVKLEDPDSDGVYESSNVANPKWPPGTPGWHFYGASLVFGRGFIANQEGCFAEQLGELLRLNHEDVPMHIRRRHAVSFGMDSCLPNVYAECGPFVGVEGWRGYCTCDTSLEGEGICAFTFGTNRRCDRKPTCTSSADCEPNESCVRSTDFCGPRCFLTCWV